MESYRKSLGTFRKIYLEQLRSVELCLISYPIDFFDELGYLKITFGEKYPLPNR